MSFAAPFASPIFVAPFASAVSTTASPRLGRPRALDQTKLREICALVSQGCAIQEAARYVGCSASTIARERQNNPEFRDRLARAEVKAGLVPLRTMRRAMVKDWRAAAWMLERTDADRFGRRAPRAISQKQARALVNDLIRIVVEEQPSPPARERLATRIAAAVQSALGEAADTRRIETLLHRAVRNFELRSPTNEKNSQTDAAPNAPVPSSPPNIAAPQTPLRTMPASSPPPHKPHPTSASRAGRDSLGRAFASQFVALLDRQLAASHIYIEPEVAGRAPAIPAAASRTDPPEAQKSALFATSEGENYQVFPSDSYRERVRKSRTFAIESLCSHE